jgi:hypothetical protein
MSTNKHHSNYTLADINDYLQGRLSPAEMHAMEKAALQDPFLADALEGLHGVDAGVAERDLAAIHARLAQVNTPAKLVYTTTSNSWMKIAAAIILFVGAGVIGWYVLKQDTGKKEIAQQNVLVTRPADSLVKQPEVKQAAPEKEKPGEALTDKKIDSRKQERIEAAEAKALAEIVAATRQRNAIRQADITAMESIRKPDSQQQFTPPAPPPPAEPEHAMLQGKVSGLTTQGSSINTRDLMAPKSIRPSQWQQFSGTILDSNANPIANASIVADQKAFVSDEKGRFVFSAPDTLQRIQVAAVGFKSTQTELKPKQPTNIVLKTDNSELNDVIVTGYGTQKRKGITAAMGNSNSQVSGEIIPANGWIDFCAYLSNSMPGKNWKFYSKKDAPLSSKLISLELVLDASGKPTTVTILSVDEKRSFKKDLTKAIRQGPSWHNMDGTNATGNRKLKLYFE